MMPWRLVLVALGTLPNLGSRRANPNQGLGREAQPLGFSASKQGQLQTPLPIVFLYSILSNTPSFPLLHLLLYSILFSTPSSHILNPFIYSILSYTPSFSLLHLLLYSILFSTPSSHIFNPFMYSILFSTPSSPILHLLYFVHSSNLTLF